MLNYQIIESPDGHIQLGTFNNNNDDLNKKHIIHISNNFNNLNNLNNINNITNNLLLIQIRNKAILVRFICLLDFSFHFILLTFSNYYPINFIIIIISFAGFESTYTYNINSIILYLLYQYIQTCFKLFMLTCWFAATLSHDINEIQIINNMLSIDTHPAYIALFICVCLSQIFITYHVQSYYLLLSRIHI